MSFFRIFLSCFLLLLQPLCLAQSGGANARGSNLVNASAITKSLGSAKCQGNMILFSIKGHHVLGLLHNRYKKLQLIYIFPNDPEATDSKTQLEQAAKEVHAFFLPRQNPALIHIHEDALFAQIRVEASASIHSSTYGESTTNLVLRLLRSVGNPQSWRDNRLIWQIPFNNNRSCLELALDLSQADVRTLDFNLRGSNGGTEAILNLIGALTGLNFREKENTAEGRSWRSYTGFSTAQIVAAAPRSGFSRRITNSSIFLVKKGKHFRLASSHILQNGNKDESTWAHSDTPDYPTALVDLSPEVKPSTTPAKSTPEIPTPIPRMTPSIALEQYINILTGDL
ncbi:MAG: hypothetical protein R3Y56_06880 [Akkermansia sp.]